MARFGGKPRVRLVARSLLSKLGTESLPMTARNAGFSMLFALASTPAIIPAEAAGTPNVNAAEAPTGTLAGVRKALSESVERQLSEAGLEPSLRRYTISPSLVQLRRYVDQDSKRGKWVCVVDLALRDVHHSVVARVRGNATGGGAGATARDTLDAAAHAAVSRLPQALQALEAGRKKPEKIAQR